MKTLILMCGPAGCGKSTWAKAQPNAKVISRDEVRFSILEDRDDYFAKEKEVFKIWTGKIQEALYSKDESFDYVIADATHLNSKSRFKTLCNLTFDKVICAYVKVDLETCLEQNRQRTGRAFVPEDRIINMYETFEIPKCSEYGNPIVITVEDAADVDLANI